MSNRLECDIVLRGGIASGIVYPTAIAKLAETYDFRSIGGTSAGAIAATWTAATALGRRRGEDKFQTKIKNHPQELASKANNGKTVYENLFQPQPSTRRLFNIFIASIGGKNDLKKWAGLILKICTSYPLLSFTGVTLSILPFFVLHAERSAAGPGHTWISAIPIIATAVVVALLALFLALLAAFGGLVRDILVHLPKNGFGLCSGSNQGKANAAGVLPLTDWLHEFIQRLAGYQLDRPVTFGDLWNNGGDENAKRDIELVMMTTNITRGVSSRLPFLEGSWGPLFFREDDLAQLFPPAVVKWMKSHAQKAHAEQQLPKCYHRLPRPADLPILFGARLSASLPFLLSAVPLYAPYVSDSKVSLKCCWFSDGGLASNFPLHLFDAPIPLRPTFAINFVPDSVEAMEIDEVDGKLTMISRLGANKLGGQGCDKVWMPIKNTDGIASAARFNCFTDVPGFCAALLNTALNWADTELMAMPGYRDRIVHVKLAPDEGGINLNMPDRTIMSVSKRGEFAGELLTSRFAPQPGNDIELTWDNHRWVRYRSVMASLEVFARTFRANWKHPSEPWRTYTQLLSRKKNDKPRCYPFLRPDQYAFARSATRQVVDLAKSWKKETFDIDPGGAAPKPKLVLRATPSRSDN